MPSTQATDLVSPRAITPRTFMFDSVHVAPFALSIVFASLCYLVLRSRPTNRPLPRPPGPTGLPLVGNILDLPLSQPWHGLSDLGRAYGGIVHLNVLGKSIVVLNDAQHAIEMLDKKGRIYSDRPVLIMAGRLVGWDEGPALSPFCDRWSEYRKLMAQFMGTRAKIDGFNDVLQDETRQFLSGVLRSPSVWVGHAEEFASTIVLRLAYGYKPHGKNDRLVKLVKDAMDQFSETTATNAFLVDTIPALRFVPEWFPGAAWKKKAREYRRTLDRMLNTPYDWTKNRIAEGNAQPSFIHDRLRDREISGDEEYTLKWAAAGIYSGGADTTVAAIESFVLAMTLQTSAQRTAQDELDAVLGANCLPTLADRERLPYVEALYMEVLRTHTFGPIGLPHVSREDDFYNGYFIPKGSIVITNVWQFFRDSKMYSDPERFFPGRFMGSSKEQDPQDYLFGFGRRRCPGVHLADASMWLACVSLLAAFEILPSEKDGELVRPSGKFLDGSISHPERFECVIRPRSSELRRLVSLDE